MTLTMCNYYKQSFKILKYAVYEHHLNGEYNVMLDMLINIRNRSFESNSSCVFSVMNAEALTDVCD